MKVALLTIWHEYNYGAELQSYATIKYLKILGHEVSFVNYKLANERDYSLKGKLAQYLLPITKIYRKFDSFWKKYFPLTKEYKSFDELSATPPIADIYVVGSDQVWNSDITKKSTPIYYLGFVPKSIRKISISSSFGRSEVSSYEKDMISKYLSDFYRLSVREASGVNIIRDNCGKDAIHLLDPVFLFNNYNELIGEYNKRNNLVFFPLSEDKQMEDFAIEMARELKLSYKNANKKTKITKSLVWDAPSVEEWIKSIAEASFVITPSFHGMVLSLLYNKPFVVIYPHNISRSVRIVEMLKYLRLEKRFFSSYSSARQSNVWYESIDYGKVNQLIEIRREEMKNYIKTSLL